MYHNTHNPQQTITTMTTYFRLEKLGFQLNLEQKWFVLARDLVMHTSTSRAWEYVCVNISGYITCEMRWDWINRRGVERDAPVEAVNNKSIVKWNFSLRAFSSLLIHSLPRLISVPVSTLPAHFLVYKRSPSLACNVSISYYIAERSVQPDSSRHVKKEHLTISILSTWP